MSNFAAPIQPPFEENRWAAVLNSDPATRLVTGAYDADAFDSLIRVDAAAAAVTVTLPPADLLPGKVITVKRIDGSVNAVTVAGRTGQTIDGAASISLAAQWASVTVQSNGSTWDLIGKV